MLILGIDQITIVCKMTDKGILALHTWSDYANSLIKEIDKVLMLEETFGEKNSEVTGLVQGYTNGYSYGYHSFNFRICFHEAYWESGIAINFSAQALAYYCDQAEMITGARPEVYEILKVLGYTMQKRNVDTRLSRIDMYADFIDESLSVHELNKELTSGKYSFYYSNGRKNTSQHDYYTKNGIVETLYIGSKGKNIRSLLRIYNKRREQLQTHGIRYDEALKCSNWIRMENEIKGSYAHDLTKELLKINSKEEQANLIGTCLLNKYTLADNDGNIHKISKLIETSIQKKSYYFRDVHCKDFSLQQSYEYLVTNSGLLPFLYKLWELDHATFNWFIKDLIRRTKDFEPNRNTKAWLKVHEEFYKENGVKLNSKFSKKH